MSEFNQGWWSCFERFASEILENGPADGSMERSCFRVLKAAGVNRDEVRRRLLDEATRTSNEKVVATLQDYVDTDDGNRTGFGS